MSGAWNPRRSALPRLTLAFAMACALSVAWPVVSASGSPITSSANIPHSGISPGGVNMATGELILVLRPDLQLAGPMPLVFGRRYASMLAREGLAAGHMGPNWLGTYDFQLLFAGNNVDVITNEGQDVRFQPVPGGSWSLVSPTDHAYALGSVGTGFQFTDPVARRSYLFDAATGRLMQILDEHGNALTLSYVGGQLSQVSDGLGRALAFGYDPLGFLSSVSDGTRSVSFAYAGGVLTGATDAAGHPWSYAYDAAAGFPGLLTAVTEPLGNAPVLQGYDALGRVATQTDAANGAAAYAFDTPLGNTFTDPLGNTWKYLHDTQNRLVTLLDPGSLPWSFAYDALGRLSSVTRPLSDATTFDYDPASGYPSAVGFADGTSIHWSYSPHAAGGATFFDLAGTLYPDLSSSSCVRDAAGNLTDLTDRGGFHWQATYNERGQILTSTNPATGGNSLTYDPMGRVASSSDPAGNLTSYGYDELSRLVQVTHADLSTRSYAYDALDRLTGVTDERGKIWSFVHDADGRLTTETDPLTHAIQYTYDAVDRMTQVTDPLGHSTLYAYDAGGRLSSVTDRTSRVVTFTHDAWGNLTGSSDAANATWGRAYDSDLRLTSASDPLGHAILLGHDFRDRVTHVTDPVSTEFDYAYDAMGRLQTATAPLGHSLTFNHDARGLLTSALNATSETQFARTPLGEVGQVTDPNLNPWLRGHDTQGRLSNTVDPLGRTSGYAYDSRDRLAHMDLPVGSLDLNHDVASRLLGATFSTGPALAFAYDDANRLTSASGASFTYDEADRMTSSNGLGFAYDHEGRITAETYGPGKVVSYSYDDRGLLSQVSDWLSGVTTFTYDAAHRLTGITRPNGTSATYAYDAADRHINFVEKQPGPVQTPIASIAITRDALGQIASIQRSAPVLPSVGSAGTTNFAYDAASQVTGLTWDGLGRLTGDGTRSFVWDGASRLTHYTAGTESPTFTYDAFGSLLSRTQGAASEQYVWNYANGSHTLDVVVQGGLQARHYVHTPAGLLLYSIAGNARHYYHYDENGNTMFLTNDAGAVVANYIYSPTGEVSGSGASLGNLFTLGAAGGALQLGSSGVFAAGGGIYDSRFARVVSGGATASGAMGFIGPMHGNSDVTGGSELGGQDLAMSGLAEVYGQDALVSTGPALFPPPSRKYVGELWLAWAGTSFHELGHSSKLNHGGASGGDADAEASAPCTWCLPANHVSTMKYNYGLGDPEEDAGGGSTTFGRKVDFSAPCPTCGAGISGISELRGNDIAVTLGGSEFAGAGDMLPGNWETPGPTQQNSRNRVPIDGNCDGVLVTGSNELCPWCKPLENRPARTAATRWAYRAGSILNRPAFGPKKGLFYHYVAQGHGTHSGSSGLGVGRLHFNEIELHGSGDTSSALCLWCPR